MVFFLRVDANARGTFAMETPDELVSFWRQHIEGWKKSDLSQRAYCSAHNLSRRTFQNWRLRFKADDAVAERKLRWRHLRPRRPSVDPSVSPMPMAPPRSFLGIPRPNRQRQFPDELKRQIVEETLLPGATVSSVARLYGVTPPCVFRWRKLMGLGTSGATATFAPVRIGGETDVSSGAPALP
ncbi:MAG: transposase [Micropepsaceae bacterium]